MIRTPTVFSAIQEISTGRVYVLFRDELGFYWIRARSGYEMRGPHLDLYAMFEEMSAIEGKSTDHWIKAFAQFRPEIETLIDSALRPKPPSSDQS